MKYAVLSWTEEIESLPAKKALVGGRLVFASLGQATAPPDFVRLADRNAAGGFVSLRGALGAPAPRVQVYVHSAIASRQRTRYALTIDAYLRWGQRHAKGTVALLGGIESNSGVSLEVLIFRDRQLVQITERELPPRHALDFDATVDAVLDELRTRYPGLRLVSAAPLSDWGRSDAEYIGGAALIGLRFMPLAAAGGNARAYRTPLLIAAAGVLAYSSAIGAGWTLQRRAMAAYEATANAPAIKAAGGIQNANLEVMEQRRLFMAAERRQELLTNRGTAIIAGVGAVAGVRILELRLPAPSLAVSDQVGVAIPSQQPAGTPDVHMQLLVPKADMPALDQAKVVLRAVSAQTGMDLYLAHNGWREDATNRIYNVEGAIR